MSAFARHVARAIAEEAQRDPDRTFAVTGLTAAPRYCVLAATADNPERFAQLRALRNEWYPRGAESPQEATGTND